MQRIAHISRALSDPGRLRLLMAIAGDERCVCQLIDVLGLAPSTVSKHVSVLHDAGLVLRRKRGKWAYYRLPGRDAPLEVRRAIRWVRDALADDPEVLADADRLEAQSCVELETLTACYRHASTS